MSIHVACLWMCVLFYFSFVCLHVCVYASKFEVHCGSAFEPGASGLSYYCTPPVCVLDVLGALAVWWHTKKEKDSCQAFLIHIPCFLMCVLFSFSFIWWRVYAFAFKSMVHCGSAFKPGASWLPYYCTPPVCVPAVLGARAVWRQNTKKNHL